MSSSAVLDQVLRPALERAVVVARTPPVPPFEAVEVPVGLRRLLRFAKLPPKALATARAALENEPEFLERVAAESTEELLGRASWLFLTRPDGWEGELDEIVDRAESDRSQADERSAQRDVARLQSIVAGLEVRLRQSEAHGGRLDQEVRREQARADAAEALADRLLGDLDQARSERTDAVRRLKTTEARLAQRSAELRMAQAGPQPAVADVAATDARDDEVEQRAAAAARLADDLAAQVQQLSGAVRDLRRELHSIAPSAAHAAVEAAAPRDGASPRPARRRPTTLHRGVFDDSPEAVEQLFSLDGAVVLIDGYNVTMTAWPQLAPSDQRRALEQAATTWHARYGADFVLVFDGDDVGGRAVRTAGSPVRVIFSAADVEADDEILSLIAEVAPEHPCIVVSDDRRVREGAWQRGANVAGSGQVLSLLRR
jgi:predicted RNA-binding protein with PIN domain